jgi:hypothetical protein
VLSCLFIVWREFAIARQIQKPEPETSL